MKLHSTATQRLKKSSGRKTLPRSNWEKLSTLSWTHSLRRIAALPVAVTVSSTISRRSSMARARVSLHVNSPKATVSTSMERSGHRIRTRSSTKSPKCLISPQVRRSYYPIRIPNRICSERTNRICPRLRLRLRLRYPTRQRINRQEGCSLVAIGRHSKFHSRIPRSVHHRPHGSCLALKVNPHPHQLCLLAELCKIQVAILSARPRRDRRSHLLHQPAHQTRL